MSKENASLDAWLTLAGRVLEDQREQDPFPSFVPWNEGQVERLVRVDVFLVSLVELLDNHCRRPGRWILIAEDARIPHHFWQALCFEDGSMVAEVVSNYYLEGDDRWAAEQEERLAELGWLRPDPPRQTNWLRVEATRAPLVSDAAFQAFLTLTDVFGLRATGVLRVQLFSSPLRGNTPASPE